MAEETELVKTIRPIFEGIYELKDSEGEDISVVFHTLPPRKLTEYYKLIKRPVSLNKIQKYMLKYTNITDFITDVAQITYNARLFNEKGSAIYNYAVILDDYLRQNIDRLKQEGKYSDKELEYPYLGPLPEDIGGEDPLAAAIEASQQHLKVLQEKYASFRTVQVAGTPKKNEEEIAEEYHQDEEGEEEEEEDDFEDESYGGGRKRRGRPRRAATLKKQQQQVEEVEEQQKRHVVVEEKRRKRGRPPTVDKPHEHRIKAIMRGLRKERDRSGRPLYLEFEKLPDPKTYPEYYQQIANPIALDQIRKNIKRRKYVTVEMYLNDMTIMFNNARQFNQEGSPLYNDANTLENTMRLLAEEELKKPDSVYQDTASNAKTSRLPLDQVEHRGEVYKVGDWVHIANINDPAKPIIGQIFRIWRAADNQKWINVCWYYRPEQTVHRYDKLFYENEVVKSGQYRDHLVDQILEKCFVMFFTKYQRGRPTGIGDRAVYCCESRYNENEKAFNKIRTWKACIPDEVRSTDYPMDYFDKPRALRRVYSPIRHLLPEDASEDDPIPEPKMGDPNAPPVIGAVYKRAPQPNEVIEHPSEYADPNDMSAEPTPRQPNMRRASVSTRQQSVPYASPAANPAAAGTPYNSRYGSNHPYYMGGSAAAAAAMASPAQLAAKYAPGYGASPLPAAPSVNYGYHVPSSTIPSVYALPDNVEIQLSSKTRKFLYPKVVGSTLRSIGKTAWFTVPPLYVGSRRVLDDQRVNVEFFESDNEPETRKRKGTTVLGHSAKYMAWKKAKLT
ncbi:chromatin structure-remodeling complex subunit Rsc2p [Trichomonascus vanleenenianus]|uniref:chromatin structure-remodeling complex subunit Rsc2p n=1 Tax=Trichomonascus vanleenenianus TaxID=2268995 RepID=UPI003ECA1A81